MRSVRAVDGITRAGERRRTERQHVHAFAAIGKTGAVARDHLEPREQVMAEGDRLRDLDVPRAASMQHLAGDTDAAGEPRLDVHVHVLEAHGPCEIAARDLDAYGLQARRDGRALLSAQYA